MCDRHMPFNFATEEGERKFEYDPEFMKKSPIIYKVYHIDQPNYIYIGSTTHENTRMRRHLGNTTKLHSKKLREHFGSLSKEGRRFEVITKYPCYGKSQLLEAEEYYIEEVGHSLDRHLLNHQRSADYASNTIDINFAFLHKVFNDTFWEEWNK
jgi:Uri superfamily endonuclease